MRLVVIAASASASRGSWRCGTTVVGQSIYFVYLTTSLSEGARPHGVWVYERNKVRWFYITTVYGRRTCNIQSRRLGRPLKRRRQVRRTHARRTKYTHYGVVAAATMVNCTRSPTEVQTPTRLSPLPPTLPLLFFLPLNRAVHGPLYRTYPLYCTYPYTAARDNPIKPIATLADPSPPSTPASYAPFPRHRPSPQHILRVCPPATITTRRRLLSQRHNAIL